MGLVAVDNEICLDKKPQQAAVRCRIVVVAQHQLQHRRDILRRIAGLGQKRLHHLGCPPLVFLSGVALAVELAVPDGDIMENGCRIQDPLLLHRQSFLLSQQPGQGINLQNVLGTPGMPLLIEQGLEQQSLFFVVHGNEAPFETLIKKKKPQSRSALRFWQREKDSNPHKQSQSLSCYPYTIPLFLCFCLAVCFLVASTGVIIANFPRLSTVFLK